MGPRFRFGALFFLEPLGSLEVGVFGAVVEEEAPEKAGRISGGAATVVPLDEGPSGWWFMSEVIAVYDVERGRCSEQDSADLTVEVSLSDK